MSIVSIGTGFYNPKHDAQKVLNKNLTGWAKELPNLFMYDANMINLTMLQYLSNSPTSSTIDSEIGDLSNDLLFGKPALHYLRYDVELEKQAIEKYGVTVTEKEVESMREMSNAENVQKLIDIGVAAAAYQIKETHFQDLHS
ncbi:MAG: hypothetical protein HC912_07420 [Saprospiraceae bacterium]|nr:hypothetical protein [Saprospiraceae bacterium]